MIVKRFGCTTIHNIVLYKMHHLYIYGIVCVCVCCVSLIAALHMCLTCAIAFCFVFSL